LFVAVFLQRKICRAYLDTPGYEKVLASPSPERGVSEIAKKLPLEFNPGVRFGYSSIGYVLLGFVIEKSSGKSYESFLRENIFDPLKMVNTGCDNNKSIHFIMAEARARRVIKEHALLACFSHNSPNQINSSGY
jgi:CubicO group peptidase (beta-lactamase class C family)